MVSLSYCGSTSVKNTDESFPSVLMNGWINLNGGFLATVLMIGPRLKFGPSGVCLNR